MSELRQTENEYTPYLGWYGVYGLNESTFDLTKVSEIHKVYRVDVTGLKLYERGVDPFLQPFTSLDAGNAYYIVLEPGTDSIFIDDFYPSTEDGESLVLENRNDGSIETNIDESLFELQQKENTLASYLGWFGVVNENNCEYKDYDLTQNDKIDMVYRITGFNIESYKSDQPSYLQTFTKLEKGKCYLILLKSGKSKFKIDNFISNTSVSKLSEDFIFKLRQKTKVFVVLWNFKTSLGGSYSKFSDTKYFLGDVDSNSNPTKTNLKINHINDFLNKENYSYPEQENFKTDITGSVSDYFRSITNNQLDLKFEILNLNGNELSDNPDEYAYNILYTKNLRDTSVLKNHVINSFKFAREKYKNENFPREYDQKFAKFRVPVSFGIVIHSMGNELIRSRNIRVDVDGENSIPRKISICNITDNQNNLRLEPIGVIVHELIHSFYVKDLYVSDIKSGLGMSKIDVMGRGYWGHTLLDSGKYAPFIPSAYTRNKISDFYYGKQNIIEITETTQNIEVTTPTDSNKIIKIKHPLHDDIWYVDLRGPDILNKRCINFDRELVETGLSIVHEYPNKLDSRFPMPEYKRAESGMTVSLEQQDGLFQLQKTNIGDIELDEARTLDNKSDFFKPGDEFSPHTIPSTSTYEGIPTGIKIHNIRETENKTMIFDVTFLEEPTAKILEVNYYTESISIQNKVPQSCGGRPNCNPTDQSPFIFEFSKHSYNQKKILIEIKTTGIPNGKTISLMYLKNDAFKFTIPGGWATGVVNENRVILTIPTGMLGLYLQQQKNHFVFKVNESDYSDVFWYIDFVEMKI